MAFPECPEIYFLTGLSNPTRNDGGALPEDILQVVASKQVDVIVINQQPFFTSSKTSLEVLAAIEKAYPLSQVSDKFLIRGGKQAEEHRGPESYPTRFCFTALEIDDTGR